MAKSPTRIDLLELDIDLRLADLWREAADVEDWNLDVVAAFMRAAYGKGYCDALTEDAPGSLCGDHGYRIPVGASRRPPKTSLCTSSPARVRSGGLTPDRASDPFFELFRGRLPAVLPTTRPRASR